LKFCEIWNGNVRYVLPSKSDLQRTANRIETISEMIIQMTQFNNASGEGVRFENVEAVIALLIKVYGLHEADKKHPIEISSSADAAPVTKTLTALALGTAMTDMGVISPRTGRPLCLSAL
jgi:hypothetical protein